MMSKQGGATMNAPSTTFNTISLLCKNLKLLDLDLRDDWPHVSPQIFTNQDNPGNHKIRVQCTEWTLFHLYHIWDKEECRDVSL